MSHPRFNRKSLTGRIRSDKVEVRNIKYPHDEIEELRKKFAELQERLAPLWEADFSSVEYRLLASLRSLE